MMRITLKKIHVLFTNVYINIVKYNEHSEVKSVSNFLTSRYSRWYRKLERCIETPI